MYNEPNTVPFTIDTLGTSKLADSLMWIGPIVPPPDALTTTAHLTHEIYGFGEIPNRRKRWFASPGQLVATGSTVKTVSVPTALVPMEKYSGC